MLIALCTINMLISFFTLVIVCQSNKAAFQILNAFTQVLTGLKGNLTTLSTILNLAKAKQEEREEQHLN